MRIAIAAIIVLALWSQAFSATYYASPTGSGSTCSVGSPCSLSSGTAKLSASGGDTLIVNDGTYSTGTINSVTNGTSEAYNIVRAANDGAAILTNSSAVAMNESNTSQYIQFEGLKFQSTSEKHIFGNHLKFLRCAFEGGPSSGNVVTVLIGIGASYILMEDCWSYGLGGRYNFLIYQANHIVMRRCIVRHDGGWSGAEGTPEAGFNAYESSYVSFQNCIAIDCNLSYDQWYSAFYQTGSGAFNNLEWNGVIALNSSKWGLAADPKSGGSATYTVKNSSIYETGEWVFTGGTGSNGTITNSLFGGDANGLYANSGVSIQNSIVFDVSTDKMSGITCSYSDIEGGGETCSNGQTYNPETNGLLYLPRIETSSNLSSQGSGGGRIGPMNVCRIGTSGTLYGETGWNTEYTCALTGGGGGSSANNLWPWPYEDRIKTDMAAISERGFTTGNSMGGSAQTLTRYIWEYLGNQIPDDIYAASPSGYITGSAIMGGTIH